MTSYLVGQQFGDGSMSSAAIHDHNGGYHTQYHPQEPLIHHTNVSNTANAVMAGQMADEGAYMGMMNSGEYGAGNFMPLPQAPRLPIAAARTTSMAAMYYDPSLHPQHAYSSNMIAQAAPWAVPYYGTGNVGEYNPAAPYQHQHVEQQMMLHNQMNRIQQQQHHPHHNHHHPQQHLNPNVYGAGSYANAGQPVSSNLTGSMTNYVDQSFRHANPTAAAAYNGNGGVPPTAPHSTYGWDAHWAGAAPEEYDPTHAASYRANVNSHRNSSSSVQNQNEQSGPYADYNGQSGEGMYGGDMQNLQPLEQQYHPANAGAGWSGPRYPENVEGSWHEAGQIQQYGAPVQHSQPYHPQSLSQSSAHRGGDAMWSRHGAQAYDPAWQGRIATAPNTSLRPSHPSNMANAQNWHDDQRNQHFAPQPINVPHHHGDAGGNPGLGLHPLQPAHYQAPVNPTVLPVAENPVNKNGVGPVQDGEPNKNTSAPAPPSPDTLDKSAVPVSSVGAEIIWIAAAAMLDPSLWLRSSKTIKHSPRRRMSSQGSNSETSSVSTPFTSPLNDTNDSWANAMVLETQDTEISERLPASEKGESSNSRNKLPNDPYDESSASSSEPGTPLTSIPSRIWEKDDNHGKHTSLSALHGMRALEVSNGSGTNPSDSSYTRRRSTSPMDISSPRARSGFQRTASHDRAREAVTGVTHLLDREWRWSMNDDKLISLNQSQRSDARFEESKNIRTSTSPRREEFGHSMPGTEPSPAFRRFAHQVLAQTLVSPTAFMLSLMYSLRVLHLAIITRKDGSMGLDPEAVEIFAQPPSAAPFKLFTLGLMIANKHLDDNTFLNKTWNEVTGISLVELNRAERWFLEKSSYEITVPEQTWVRFLEQLHIRTERKVSSLASSKRIRVPTKQAPDGLRRQDSYVVPHAGSEEAHKRFLLGIEDALQALGYGHVFNLTETETNGHENAPSARPKASLTQLRYQCRSAPAVETIHSNGGSSQDSDFDVFEDESGPYRPHSASIRRLTMHNVDGRGTIQKRKSQTSLGGESMLSRSISDGFTPTINCAREQNRLQAKRESKTDLRAPLAPSVLLDLLNRGQQLAHAAH